MQAIQISGRIVDGNGQVRFYSPSLGERIIVRVNDGRGFPIIEDRERSAYIPLTGDMKEFQKPVIEELKEVAQSGKNGQAIRAGQVLRAMEAEGNLARAQIEYQISERQQAYGRPREGDLARDALKRGYKPSNGREIGKIAEGMGFRVESEGHHGHISIYKGKRLVTKVPNHRLDSRTSAVLVELSRAYSS